MRFLKRHPHRSAGVTLIELLVVLGALSVIAVMTLPRIGIKADEAVARGIIEDVNRLQRASMRHRRDTGAWPANATALVTGGYVSAGEIVDPWGTPFQVSVVGTDLQIVVNARENRFAARVTNQLPRSSVTGTTVTTLIDPPGEEAAHDALYARNGSRPLTGAMNANSNNINNVATLTAAQGNITTLNSTTVSASTVTAAGAVTSSEWFRTNGAGGWYNNTYGGGWHMSDTAWIRAYGDKGVYTGGQLQGGTVQANGRMYANEYVQLGAVATAGWGCTPNGLLGRDAAGASLSCVSGIWTAAGGKSPAAFGRVNTAGGLSSPYGASSAGRLGVGWYRVNLSPARPDASYTINCTTDYNTNNSDCSIRNRQTTYFEVQLARKTGGGSYTTVDQDINFVVFDDN